MSIELREAPTAEGLPAECVATVDRLVGLELSLEVCDPVSEDFLLMEAVHGSREGPQLIVEFVERVRASAWSWRQFRGRRQAASAEWSDSRSCAASRRAEVRSRRDRAGLPGQLDGVGVGGAGCGEPAAGSPGGGVGPTSGGRHGDCCGRPRLRRGVASIFRAGVEVVGEGVEGIELGGEAGLPDRVVCGAGVAVVVMRVGAVVDDPALGILTGPVAAERLDGLGPGVGDGVDRGRGAGTGEGDVGELVGAAVGVDVAGVEGGALGAVDGRGVPVPESGFEGRGVGARSSALTVIAGPRCRD